MQNKSRAIDRVIRVLISEGATINEAYEIFESARKQIFRKTLVMNGEHLPKYGAYPNEQKSTIADPVIDISEAVETLSRCFPLAVQLDKSKQPDNKGLGAIDTMSDDALSKDQEKGGS